MVIAVFLSVINVAGTTAITARNNKKRRTNLKKLQGEHGKHRPRRCFSIIFSFSIVQSCRGSPMLNRDDLKKFNVCFVVGEAFKLDSIIDRLGSSLFGGVTYLKKNHNSLDL